MKHLYNTVISLLSICLLSGCGVQQQQFHYEAEEAESEEENELEQMTKMVTDRWTDLDFELTGDSAFVIKDDVSLYYVKRTYETYQCYLNVYHDGLCSFSLHVIYNNGMEDTVEYDRMNTTYQHLVTLALLDNTIETVEIELTPVDGEYTELYSFGTQDDLVEKVGENTIESHVDGTIEVYDKYATAMHVLDVEKGVKYNINFGAASFSVLDRR